METIKEFLSQKGIPETDIILDGQIKSLTLPNFKGWYIGNDLGDGKKRITIEDWRTKDRHTISEGFDHNDPQIRAQIQEQQKEFQAAKDELHLLKKKFAQNDWLKFQASPHKKSLTKYLEKKSIDNLFGALAVPSLSMGYDVIIPIHELTPVGEIWNYQRIQEDGFKSFVPGAMVDGLCFELAAHDPVDHSKIFITEGFATACSIKMAVNNYAVICAFYAENLQAVAEKTRAMYPDAEIILCADDDWKVKGNPGRTKADLAASKVSGKLCVPNFGEKREKGFTDWNDLHTARGLEVVVEQLAKPIQPKFEMQIQTSPTIKPYVNGIAPMPLEIDKDGKLREPPEFKIAKALYDYYEGKIVSDEKDLFIYDGKHWKLVDLEGEKSLRRQLHVLYNGKASSKKVSSSFTTFCDLVPPAGRPMFSPNPYRINFSNGTLHVLKKNDAWTMEFKPHAKEDYCISLIPIEFDTTRKVRNPEFEAMLARILAPSTDPEEKLKAVRQMYGACVAPIFPHLFMLHGPGGSGKTSLILGAMNLVNKANISMVAPHEFQGFSMESMAGKLVNVVTDINLMEPIKDDHIKKIEDRIPIRIDRKFKTAVMAPLPAVHVFGGNDIPATYEKGSGAHERRWTFLEVAGFKADGNYSKSFANEVFELCPQGVLNFALDGLQEVLDSNGHYFTPETGRQKMKKWQMEHDPVALFVDEIEQGEVASLKLDPKGRAPRSGVWQAFVFWYDSAYNRKPKIGKIKFYDALLKCKASSAKFEVVTPDGVRCFSGLSVTDGVIQKTSAKFTG